MSSNTLLIAERFYRTSRDTSRSLVPVRPCVDGSIYGYEWVTRGNLDVSSDLSFAWNGSDGYSGIVLEVYRE